MKPERIRQIVLALIRLFYVGLLYPPSYNQKALSFELRCAAILRICLAVAGITGTLTTMASAQDSQVSFRGGPNHLGVYNSSAPDQLSLRWAFKTGGPIVSSPSVADGVVYVGSADRNLYAVEAATGRLRWKFDAHGDVNSSPAVANGLVYVVSLDGHLYAVDATTGKQRWTFATQGEHRYTAPGILGMLPPIEMMPDPWDFFLSSPSILNGTAYFGSGDSYVYAVDAKSGRLRWKFKTGDVVHSSPAIANGLVYIGSWDTYFYALNAATGNMVWKFKTGEDPKTHTMTGIQASAAVANGTVYFGCRDANFYALNAKTGTLKWKVPNESSWVISSPAVEAEAIYYTTSDSHVFQALDNRTGRTLYSLPTRIYSFSSPAVAGRHAYFGTFDGQLHDVNLETRAYTGTFATLGFRANGQHYLGPDGQLRSDFWTGDILDDMVAQIRGQLFAMGSILSSPAAHAGTIYFGSVDGNVYALGPSK